MLRILMLSVDRVGRSMAGPGIRYWQLSRALSRHHDVTLVARGAREMTSDTSRLHLAEQLQDVAPARRWDALVTQELDPAVVRWANAAGARLLFDAYDPVLLENLEVQRHSSPRRRWGVLRQLRQDMTYALSHADAIVCASEKQRDLWLGATMALGLITPSRYATDPSLRAYLDVVPFGIDLEEEAGGGTGPRQLFGLGADDHILLWGGGIWEWFDPLTPIRAVARLRDSRPPVRLVFMGTRHPNPALGAMPMTARAIDLARELGLLDRQVFFHDGWVPYHDRLAWFGEASLGLSTHFDHLETRFAFRTRLLDYIGARVPIITTEGDALAEVVAARDLGAVVGSGDVAGVEAAVRSFLGDPQRLAATRERLGAVRAEMSWERSAAALSRCIARCSRESAPRPARLGYVARRATTALLRDGAVATAARLRRQRP
ncbi:MAG: glycosyltransferase family 4 protein [Candidatus Dormibacteria bacterium]